MARISQRRRFRGTRSSTVLNRFAGRSLLTLRPPTAKRSPVSGQSHATWISGGDAGSRDGDVAAAGGYTGFFDAGVPRSTRARSMAASCSAVSCQPEPPAVSMSWSGRLAPHNAAVTPGW